MHRVVPTHVARHNLVGGAPVLNIVRKRVVIGVGGGFGCVCNQIKKQNKTVLWKQCKNTGNIYQNDYFTVLMFGTKRVLGYVQDFTHRFGKLNIDFMESLLKVCQMKLGASKVQSCSRLVFKCAIKMLTSNYLLLIIQILVVDIALSQSKIAWLRLHQC